MKLAYLTNQYPAPSHTFIRREIAAHEKAGHEVLRFSIRRYSGELADADDRAELTRTKFLLSGRAAQLGIAMVATCVVAPLRMFRAVAAARQLSRRGERGLFTHLVYLAEACLLRRWTQAAGVQHIHAHFGTNPAAVAMLCRLLGGPSYSFTVHGPDEFDRAPALSLAAKTHHAAFIVAISHFGQSQLFRWIDASDYSKVKIIRCGLDDAFLVDIAPKPIASEPRFVFVGRLTTTKGVFVLADALVALKVRRLSPEVLIIGDGPERERLGALLASKNVSEGVKFLGWQSNEVVRAEIQRSQVLILPSFAEGLPVVLMESLAMGRPVITTWIAAIPELVTNGVNGWLIHAGSAEALANAMEKAMQTSPNELARMGASGRVEVLRSHNAQHEAEKLARHIEDAISKK